MADHYISINRGKHGTTPLDFTTGVASTATDEFELRILDGTGATKKDVLNALDSFKRFINSELWSGTFPPDL